jgi:hypothetical protein
MVRLAPPELVRFSVRLSELPTVTFPKLKLAGFGVSWPGVTPVPERPMFNGEPGASETIARVPFAAPPTVGEKVTVNVALCPAVRVVGRLGPVKLNPVPVAEAVEIVTVTVPVFVTMTGMV